MGKIYTADGWINWDYLYNETKFIMAVTGARGTGKTFGLLKYILEHNLKFLYIRRLKTQLDYCLADDDNNPFKAINSKCGYQIRGKRKKESIRFIDDSRQDENWDPPIIGYGAALSVAIGIRGADYSDVDIVLFDEYIAMSGEKPIPQEATKFYDLLETVNRNRELEGRPPVKVFMLGNANKLMNPYFLHWHFMRTALKMIRGEQMMWRSPNNNRIMVFILKSPISERKKQTALYSENADKGFFNVAIDNAFATDATAIKPAKLTDLKHICGIGEIGIYQLKSTGYYYASETIQKTSNYYPENEINLRFFRARFGGLKTIYLGGFFVFENYDCELLFREYIGL